MRCTMQCIRGIFRLAESGGGKLCLDNTHTHVIIVIIIIAH